MAEWHATQKEAHLVLCGNKMASSVGTAHDGWKQGKCVLSIMTTLSFIIMGIGVFYLCYRWADRIFVRLEPITARCADRILPL